MYLSWTDAELQKWSTGVEEESNAYDGHPMPTVSGEMTTKKRAELVAILTVNVMNYAQETVGNIEL